MSEFLLRLSVGLDPVSKRTAQIRFLVNEINERELEAKQRRNNAFNDAAVSAAYEGASLLIGLSGVKYASQSVGSIMAETLKGLTVTIEEPNERAFLGAALALTTVQLSTVPLFVGAAVGTSALVLLSVGGATMNLVSAFRDLDMQLAAIERFKMEPHQALSDLNFGLHDITREVEQPQEALEPALATEYERFELMDVELQTWTPATYEAEWDKYSLDDRYY